MNEWHHVLYTHRSCHAILLDPKHFLNTPKQLQNIYDIRSYLSYCLCLVLSILITNLSIIFSKILNSYQSSNRPYQHVHHYHLLWDVQYVHVRHVINIPSNACNLFYGGCRNPTTTTIPNLLYLLICLLDIQFFSNFLLLFLVYLLIWRIFDRIYDLLFAMLLNGTSQKSK